MNVLQQVDELLLLSDHGEVVFNQSQRLAIRKLVYQLQNESWSQHRELKELREKLTERNEKLHTLSVELAKAKKNMPL